MFKWAEILWDFTKFEIKKMLKFSAFYFDKQKSFLPKKRHEVYQVSRIVLFEINRWPLDVLTFLIHGFGKTTFERFFFLIKILQKTKTKSQKLSTRVYYKIQPYTWNYYETLHTYVLQLQWSCRNEKKKETIIKKKQR